MDRMDEKGMTLIEVIVTLLLVSLVGGIIWTLMMTSMKYNIVETKKLQMQQEANNIVTQIQTFHRKCKTYEMTVNPESVSLFNCTSSNSAKSLADVYMTTNYNYSSFPNQKIVDTLNADAKMELTLTVQDPKKTSLKVVVETVISRYKSDL